MINANKIRGRIKELGTTQEKVAEKIGMSAKTFSIKLNTGKFGLDEAERIDAESNANSLVVCLEHLEHCR